MHRHAVTVISLITRPKLYTIILYYIPPKEDPSSIGHNRNNLQPMDNFRMMPINPKVDFLIDMVILPINIEPPKRGQ